MEEFQGVTSASLNALGRTSGEVPKLIEAGVYIKEMHFADELFKYLSDVSSCIQDDDIQLAWQIWNSRIKTVNAVDARVPILLWCGPADVPLNRSASDFLPKELILNPERIWDYGFSVNNQDAEFLTRGDIVILFPRDQKIYEEEGMHYYEYKSLASNILEDRWARNFIYDSDQKARRIGKRIAAIVSHKIYNDTKYRLLLDDYKGHFLRDRYYVMVSLWSEIESEFGKIDRAHLN